MITITVKEEQLKEWIKAAMILKDLKSDGKLIGVSLSEDLFVGYDELADEIVEDFVRGY